MVSESEPLKVRGLPYTSCCSTRPCSSRHLARCQFTPSVPAHPVPTLLTCNTPSAATFAVFVCSLQCQTLAREAGAGKHHVDCLCRSQGAALLHCAAFTLELHSCNTKTLAVRQWYSSRGALSLVEISVVVHSGSAPTCGKGPAVLDTAQQPRDDDVAVRGGVAAGAVARGAHLGPLPRLVGHPPVDRVAARPRVLHRHNMPV